MKSKTPAHLYVPNVVEEKLYPGRFPPMILWKLSRAIQSWRDKKIYFRSETHVRASPKHLISKRTTLYKSYLNKKINLQKNVLKERLCRLSGFLLTSTTKHYSPTQQQILQSITEASDFNTKQIVQNNLVCQFLTPIYSTGFISPQHLLQVLSVYVKLTSEREICVIVRVQRP